jgi:hypothetical protein
MAMFDLSVLHRLAKALNLPSNVTDLTIRLPAAGLAEMTIERILTAEEIDALSEWYVTENIEAFQLGETTYTLERREPQPEVQS